MTSSVPRFYGDWQPTITYPAYSYGADWNGWAVPVVTLYVLQRVIDDSPTYRANIVPRVSAGDPLVVTIETNQDSADGSWEVYQTLQPRADGGYLLDLGWTFDIVDESWVRAYVGEYPVWVAGCNVPGYLPESDTAVYVEQQDARAYVLDMVQRLAEDLNQDSADTLADAAQEAALDIELDGDGEYTGEFAVTLDIGHSLPLVYWVQRSTVSDVFGDDPEDDERFADIVTEITDSERV